MSGSEVPQTREISSKCIELFCVPFMRLISDKQKLTQFGVRVAVVVIVLTIVTALIVHSISKSQNTSSANTSVNSLHYSTDPETIVTSQNLRTDPSISYIVSVTDLYRIDSTCSVARVDQGSKLVDIEPPSTDKNIQTTSIQELIISEQLSEKWVAFFVTTFRSLDKLTLDIDQLCLGSLDVSPAELAQTLPTVNVKTLVLTNDVLCNMSTWIYKWKFPRLENLILNNGIISISSFVALERFLKRYSREQKHGARLTLRVQLNNYTLCALCDLTNARKLRYILVQG